MFTEMYNMFLIVFENVTFIDINITISLFSLILYSISESPSCVLVVVILFYSISVPHRWEPQEIFAPACSAWKHARERLTRSESGSYGRQVTSSSGNRCVSQQMIPTLWGPLNRGQVRRPYPTGLFLTQSTGGPQVVSTALYCHCNAVTVGATFTQLEKWETF